jgi:hypothetical protein
MLPESGVAPISNISRPEQVPCPHPTAPEEDDFRVPRPSVRVVLSVLGLFAIALVVYALVWRQAPVMTLDSPSYMRLARDIKHLTLSRLQERTPGFPLFLILTGSENGPTRLLFYSSLLVHFATIGILAYLLDILAVPRLLTALFLVISLLPPYVEPAAYVMTETLSQFLIVVACVALVFWLARKRNVFLVLFSAAAMSAAFVRPTFQALAPFLAMCAVLCFVMRCTVRMSIRRLLISLGVAVLIPMSSLAAYAYVNYLKFEYFGTSSMGAFTASVKTVSFIEELPDQYADIRDILLKYRDTELLKPFSDHTAQMTAWRAVGELRRHYGNNERTVVTRLADADWYLIKHKPMSYLIECMKSLAVYWLPNEVLLSNGGSGILRAIWAVLQLAVIGFFILQGAAVCGFGLIWLSLLAAKRSSLPRLNRRLQLSVCAYVMGSGLIAYTAAISCFLGTGIPRLRTPSELLIIATSVIGCVIWSDIRCSVISHVRSGIQC